MTADPLAEVIQRVTDLWDEPLDEVHDIPPIVDALLASPALARVIREAKAEAWVEGWIDRDNYCMEPHSPRMHNPYRDQTEEPT